MSIYAVDKVNGTMYSKFDVGYRMTSEKATVKPNSDLLLWRMSILSWDLCM